MGKNWGLNLQFGFPIKKVNFVNHYLHYEKFIQQMSKYKGNNEHFEEVLTKIKLLSHEGYKSKNNSNKSQINIDLLDSLKKKQTRQ